MNKISGEDLQRLADMTRLCFGEEEKQAMMRALDEILTMRNNCKKLTWMALMNLPMSVCNKGAACFVVMMRQNPGGRLRNY